MELKKDYSLIGPSRAKAINSGLVNADWYKTPIKREMLKKVMKRSDLKPIIDTIIWLITTETISMHIFRKGFIVFDMGYAAALTLILFIVVNIFVIIFLKITNKQKNK